MHNSAPLSPKHWTLLHEMIIASGQNTAWESSSDTDEDIQWKHLITRHREEYWLMIQHLVTNKWSEDMWHPKADGMNTWPDRHWHHNIIIIYHLNASGNIMILNTYITEKNYKWGKISACINGMSTFLSVYDKKKAWFIEKIKRTLRP